MTPVVLPTRYVWEHPEWWSVGLCGIAWLGLLARIWEHAGHEMHHRLTLFQELQHWMLMIAAMMLPLLFEIIRWTAQSSLWSRRHRAITGFLVGYAAPWLMVGVIAAGLRQASWTHSNRAAAAGFVLAAVWLYTPIHRRGVKDCHRLRPLAPFGWPADRDCMVFGIRIGGACVRSCWPLMIACSFAGHGLIAIAGGAVLAPIERWSRKPRTHAACVATLAIASYYALVAISLRG